MALISLIMSYSPGMKCRLRWMYTVRRPSMGMPCLKIPIPQRLQKISKTRQWKVDSQRKWHSRFPRWQCARNLTKTSRKCLKKSLVQRLRSAPMQLFRLQEQGRSAWKSECRRSKQILIQSYGILTEMRVVCI